jgi:hypothetical protein
MNIHELEIDKRLLAVGILDALRTARQVAFENAREMPDLLATYQAIEALYQDTAISFGTKIIPVFDRNQHIAQRIEAGDEAYTVAFGTGPAI